MKVFFNQKVINRPWGGGAQFLNNFVNYLKERGHEIVFKFKKNIDVIFYIANTKEIDPRIQKYKEKNPHTKVLHRINECDKRKNTSHMDKHLFKINELADETVFISKWLSEYFIEKGFNKPFHIVYNGCNQNYYFPEEQKELGEILNLVTHHWSSNWMKGFDIYTKLDEILNKREDLRFTYIGRYYEGYTPLNTKIIPPLYGKKLGSELRNHDVYITASRWEPCGMHHIEGASCGLPVLYHEEGGGINEACKENGLEYSDIPSLLEAIEKIKEDYNNYRNKIDYNFLSSKRCYDNYYEILLDMIN